MRVHWPPHPVCQNTVAVPTRECAAHRWAKSVLDLFCSRSVLYVGPKWNPVRPCPMYGLWEVCRPALAPVKLFIVALACIFAFLSVAIWRAFSFMCAPLSPCVFWPDVFGVGVRILGGRVGWRRLRTVAISGRRYSLHYIIHAKFSPQSLPSQVSNGPLKRSLGIC